jgi:polygalacturonase
MKIFASVVLMVITISSLRGTCQNSVNKSPWDLANNIIKNIKDPQFPNKTYNIVDFGAKGDGITKNTKAINAAINKCSKDGGGRVLITNGVFLTGPVVMKSNVDLHVDAGASLKFTTDPADYLPLVYTHWEGDECYNYSPLFYADGQKNFAITGKGTLNGQGDNQHWWPWKGITKWGYVAGTRCQLDENCRPLLKKYNDTQVPIAERKMGEGHYLRPQFINFIRCKGIKIEDVTIINSPFWVIHPLLSENVILRGVTVNSMGSNSDGCDPESCKNVLIENCTFNTGDDCIALKSGRDFDGRKQNTPIENVIIRNCNMKNGHGGVSMGSEISGGCKNIFIENCQMNSPELDNAILIKTNNSRGGVTDGIYVRNITVGEVKTAVISINSNYHIDREGQGKFPPMIKNVFISKMTSKKSAYALYLEGIKGSKCVENINVQDCIFSGVKEKNVVNDVEKLVLKNDLVNNEPLINGK